MLRLFLALILAAQADEPTTTLDGRVVDALGAPISGADVVLTGPTGSGGMSTLAQGKTDDAGWFALEHPADLKGEGTWRAVRLWASRPGERLAFVEFSGALPTAGEEVRVTLPPRGHAEFDVEGPDGRPVAGARVRLRALAPSYVNPPRELAPRFGATTDADGRATLDALSGEQVAQVEVEADGLGIQPRWFNPPLPGPRRIALRPAAPLEGRFVAEGGRLPGDWKVSATTQVDDAPGAQGGPAGRTDEVPLTDDGSFRFPAIAAGALDLWVNWPEGPDPEMLPAWPQTMIVRVGQLNRVEIPVRPAAEITGLVRERGTGEPIPGVQLYLNRPGESSGVNTRTNAQGRFAYRSLPGEARLGLNDVPPEFARTPSTYQSHEFEVPAPPGRVELPPIELLRAAPPLRGLVRDADGAPVAGATIGGSWNLVEDGASVQGGLGATTDAEGRFALHGIAPDALVSITARKGNLATSEPVAAAAGQEAEVALTVLPQPSVSITGRVLARDGTPLEGAAVLLHARRRHDAPTDDWRQLNFDRGPWLYTGPDGTFVTPPEPRREGAEFQAEAVADGFLKLQSPWMPAGEAEVVRMPDLVLRREPVERVVNGRVVDAGGSPIAGARILQRGDGPRPTETRTDADGAYRLPGVAGGRALMFAEAPGFRFGGAIAGPDGPVEIRLVRLDEPVPPLGREPEPLTRAAERELGRTLLEPEVARARAGAVDLGTPNVAYGNELARLDPDRALELLENRALSTDALVQVALARFEDDPAAALSTLDADRSAALRSYGLIALADLADAIAPDRRADLLDRALAEARRVEPAESKLVLFGEIADRWLESLDLARAAPILREGRTILETAEPELFGHQVAPFGKALAAIDLPAAEAFLKRRAPGGSDGEDVRMRDRAAMAVRAASADPEAAERLARDLGYVPNFTESHAYLIRIARNMARADLPRARAVLDLLDKPETPSSSVPAALKPYGLALLAEARAEIDPDGARALLDEAFDRLRAVTEATPGRPTYPPVPSVMAELLPLVQRLEPDSVAERLWLAAACRPARLEPMEPRQVIDLLRLAMLASRYDRPLAAAIFDPAADRLPELLPQEYGGGLFQYGGYGGPFELLAAYDPRVLADLIEQFPDPAREPPRGEFGLGALSLQSQARLAGARMLGRPPEARRRAAIESPFDSWPARGNPRYRRANWP